MTHLIIKIIIGKHISSEPFVQWQCIFAQILLPEHVLVPYDKLKHAEFFREGKVDGEVKRRILCSKDGGEGAPADGRLKSCAENGHVHKALARKEVGMVKEFLPLPRPAETRMGSRAAERRARPILRPFFDVTMCCYKERYLGDGYL